MEDDLKKKWKTTSEKKMEDELKKMEENLKNQILNLGANHSWGWLSSPRFFVMLVDIYVYLLPRFSS